MVGMHASLIPNCALILNCSTDVSTNITRTFDIILLYPFQTCIVGGKLEIAYRYMIHSICYIYFYRQS